MDGRCCHVVDSGCVVTRLCSVDGCDRPHRSRGWCVAHYYRWHRHGSPLADQPIEVGATVPSEPVQHLLYAESSRALAERLGVNKRTIVRWRAGGGIREDLAERLVIEAGRHPSEFWP